jgi:hypothetical protein
MMMLTSLMAAVRLNMVLAGWNGAGWCWLKGLPCHVVESSAVGPLFRALKREEMEEVKLEISSLRVSLVVVVEEARLVSFFSIRFHFLSCFFIDFFPMFHSFRSFCILHFTLLFGAFMAPSFRMSFLAVLLNVVLHFLRTSHRFSSH